MIAPVALLAGQRILLVEDNYLIAMELTDELNGQGAVVIGPAASVDEALHLIESTGRIDSAVLDINLKGEMIFPVVDALMELDVPFLFFTGYGQVTIPAHYTDAAHYMKPMTFTEIMKTLTEIALKAGQI